MRRLVLLAAVSATAVLLLLPSGASAAGIISSLSVDPSQVRDGATATGTVELAFPSDGATTVLLFSGDTSVATGPASVVVPDGAQCVSFPMPSKSVAPPLSRCLSRHHRTPPPRRPSSRAPRGSPTPRARPTCRSTRRGRPGHR